MLNLKKTYHRMRTILKNLCLLMLLACSKTVDSKDCRYRCKSDGTCRVTYTGPSLRSGPLEGGCFADSYGGDCSGTPPECQDCNKVISCDSNTGSYGGGRSRGRIYVNSKYLIENQAPSRQRQVDIQVVLST